MILCWLWACALTPHRIERAIQNHDVVFLVDHLQNGKPSYVREYSARGLGQVSKKESIPNAIVPLQQCISSTTEYSFVRKACALTLAAWSDVNSIPLIITAMDQVDAESRYWMAYALYQMNVPQARAQLQSLRNDVDPLLALSVRQWLED